MRRTRWLFLAAILGILVWVFATYLKNKATSARDAPVAPKPLEAGVDAASDRWVYGKSNGTQQQYYLSAAKMRSMKDPGIIELEDVELHLFHKDGGEYDLVRCAKAQFDTTAKTMYSDGQADITLGVPAEGAPEGRLLQIHSSGLHFESETGKAATDRKATFDFDKGSGSAVGADYDPQIRELHLHSQISLDWTGKSKETVPMHIEAGEAYYKERESKVVLLQWSKLTRDTLHMEGGMSIVTLDHGDVREAETLNGQGVRDDPDRKVEFGADRLKMHFLDRMQVDHIMGDGKSRLVSTSAAAQTMVTAHHMDLDFASAADSNDSELTRAVATGDSVAESKPNLKPGTDPTDTRILHSDTITLKMRTGGKDIEAVETAGIGTIDFLPNQPGKPKRWLKGDRIWIAYGTDNRIQSFKSINASTRTDKPARPGATPLPPALTESKELFATFDPKTSDLSRLEQKTNFKYQEGDRRATCDKATLEQAKDLMTLEGSARVWDSTGSAAADRIVMNQKSGDFTADGHVASTRMPDKGSKPSAMLTSDEVMQARAQHMTSTDNNLKIHYEGNAIAWQGANRVEADRLDIDRDTGIMEAHGKVKSQFVDKEKDKDANSTPKPATAPIFTVVTSSDMVYTEDTRIVDYTGGAAMRRPDMTVTGKEIRAFLKDADQDSSLDKAFSDGTVKIVSTSEKLKRTRTGTSDHAEYYADDEKVILKGGEPLLVDSVKGQTRGKQLTWFSNDDRLIVDGVNKTDGAAKDEKASTAKSIIIRKKKK